MVEKRETREFRRFRFAVWIRRLDPASRRGDVSIRRVLQCPGVRASVEVSVSPEEPEGLDVAACTVSLNVFPLSSFLLIIFPTFVLASSFIAVSCWSVRAMRARHSM